MTNLSWEESPVGKQWAALGIQGLPKDVKTTLESIRKEKEGKSFCLSQHVSDLLQAQDLIRFNVCNLLQVARSKPKRSKLVATPIPEDNVPHVTGNLLLDTGAIGSSVVSSVFFDKLRKCKHLFRLSHVKHSLVTALNKKL